jgi:REP element-mobilizing transposase RayT
MPIDGPAVFLERNSFMLHRLDIRRRQDYRRRFTGRRFWGRGYFSTTNGATTEDVVLQYLEEHIENPTGASR